MESFDTLNNRTFDMISNVCCSPSPGIVTVYFTPVLDESFNQSNVEIVSTSNRFFVDINPISIPNIIVNPYIIIPR